MIQAIRASGAPFKRLFFALPVSDSQRRAIAHWRRGLNLRSGKPVPSENFHLTLLFLGDVDAAQVPAICAAVDTLTRPQAPLRLVLDRLNSWQRAGVLALEPQETPAALRQFVYALQQALLPMGFGEQGREYRPHLTLSRDFRHQAPEAGVAPEFFLDAQVFTLYESRKGRYWPLAQWPLGDA
ncbi:RNA 2',3'-cyclic phosphodiesterase [Pseudomonas sp.]|uniref:RNA 2',3'-cyclic phosphodiesterase n=1 Tax=Pseudomonas sp. TaxID=306 RepID=UPI0028A84DF6|nr:RNA 2',3'-cyclic phosphodiesterase [Pseudomonas sp.]